MRKRSFAAVSALVLLQFAWNAAGAAVTAAEKKPVIAEPSDAVWRFDSHG
jgi:hypothetical protein